MPLIFGFAVKILLVTLSACSVSQFADCEATILISGASENAFKAPAFLCSPLSTPGIPSRIATSPLLFSASTRFLAAKYPPKKLSTQT